MMSIMNKIISTHKIYTDNLIPKKYEINQPICMSVLSWNKIWKTAEWNWNYHPQIPIKKNPT